MALAKDEFGRRLRAARERASLTQQEVADALGVDWRQIQRYDSGAAIPRASRIPKLAEILGVEPEYLQEPQNEHVIDRIARQTEENAVALRTALSLLDAVVTRLGKLDQALATHDDVTAGRVATIISRLEAVETRVDGVDQDLSQVQQEFLRALGGGDPQPPATRSEPVRNSESKTNQDTRREAG